MLAFDALPLSIVLNMEESLDPFEHSYPSPVEE